MGSYKELYDEMKSKYGDPNTDQSQGGNDSGSKYRKLYDEMKSKYGDPNTDQVETKAEETQDVVKEKPILESVERDGGIFSMEAPKKKQTAPEETPAPVQQSAPKSKDEWQALYDNSTSEMEHLEKEWQALTDKMSGGMPSAEDQKRLDELKSQYELAVQNRDAASGQLQQIAHNEITSANMAVLESWPEEDRALMQQYYENDPNLNKGFYSALKADKAENQIREKYGLSRDEFKKLAESYGWYQNEIATKTMQEEAARAVQGKPGAAIGHSALTLPATLAGTVTAPLDYLGQVFGRTGQYSTLDPNARGNLPNVYSGAVRQQVASDIAGDGSSVGRKAASYLYQGGMSALDTGARLIVTGGNAAASATLAALGSFGQTVSQASQQGASPAEAMLYGTAAAGIEALTEKLPLDELAKTAKGGWNGLKPAIISALKQAGVEATEEEISLIGTTLVEMAILRDKASTNQRIQQLVTENGMSVAEANNQVMYELLGEAMDTAVVSAISGGLSSAGGSVVAYVGRDTGGAQTAQEGAEAAQSQETTVAEVTADTAADQQQAQQGEPQSNVQKAVQEFRDTGKVSNRMAEVILNDAESVVALQKETGMELPDTASGRRNAVKDAVAQLSRNEDAKDLTSGTAEALLRKQEQPQEAKVEDPEETRRLAIEATKELQGLPKQETVGNVDTSQNGQSNQDSADMDHGAVGAAERNFSGKQAFNELLSEENAQPDRPGDVRPMEIPKKDAYGRRVSETAANLYGAEVTPDTMADTIQELVGIGALGFDTRSNDQSLKAAAASITKTGWKATEKQITNRVANGKLQDGDIEKALLLYSAYANKDDQASQDMAAELVVDLATMANMTGRNLQLFKLIRKLTPQGQLMATQKTVQRYVDQLNKKRSKNNQIQIDISQELKDDYLTAAKNDIEKPTQETARKKAEIEQAIYLSAASQIKATFAEKWNAWRYMCMLGNVKTNVRNIGGNIAQIPYTEAKRIIGAAFEKALPKEQRTKAVLGLSENDRALKEWAAADAKTETVNDALKYSAKLGDDLTSSKISDARRIFDKDVMEKARKLVADIPAGADMFFKNIEYTKSLAGFVKARGYTYADIESGKVSEAVLNEGRAYAIQEAMKATFNDANAFSDFVSNLRYKGDNTIGKAANILGEGILPFRRTPANVVVRMVENSPVNIARSVWNMATKVKDGDMSAATAIDQMAAGLTGTGAMMLGVLLASGFAGIRLRGSEVDEDEKRQGHQKYSLEFSIGGKEYSYTIDWAAPANLPLFVGANIYDILQNRNEDTGISAFTTALYSCVRMLEPLLALSCLSGLNDLFQTARQADEDTVLWAVAADIATGYFTQGIPALLRQGSQAAMPNERQTFANSFDPLLRDLQTAAANIPAVGELFKTDRIDAWGNEEDKGGAFWQVFNAFINPGTLKAIDNSDLEAEINRLNKAQPESITPPEASNKISYTDKNGKYHDGYRMTEEEYTKLRQVQGQTAYEILQKVISSSDYKALTDKQKANVFSHVYSYASERARVNAISNYGGFSKAWMMNIRGKEADTIIRKVALGDISESMTAINKALDENWNTAEAAGNMETAWKAYSRLSSGAQAEIRKEAGESAAGKYIAAREAGVTNAEYVTVLKNVAGLKPQSGYKNVREIQQAQAVGKMSGLSNAEKEAMVRGYVSDGQDQNIDDMKDLFRDKNRSFSVNDYLTAWAISDKESGKGRKDRIIAEYRKRFNLDEATAEELYKIFG